MSVLPGSLDYLYHNGIINHIPYEAYEMTPINNKAYAPMNGSEYLKTAMTDINIKAGKTYIYTVKAADGSYRSIYIADGLKIKRLSRPSLVSVKSAKKGITFKWKEVTGASGYYVYFTNTYFLYFDL